MASLEGDAPQIGPDEVKSEAQNDNGNESKSLNEDYLTGEHAFTNQDPDELMTTVEDKKSEETKPPNEIKENENVENRPLDATKQPPDLFTGTFQEEPASADALNRPQEEADVYLATPEQKFPETSLSSSLKDAENTTVSVAQPTTDLDELPTQATELPLSHVEGKSDLQDARAMPVMTGAAITASQESQSSETPVVTMQGIEGQGQLYQQQPTYVLLQTTGDQDGSGQPQVFLAMQTGAVTGQDSQAYITLHPVSVEGQEISGAFSSEGLNLQQAVLSQSGISGDVSLELNPHVSLADVKGLQLSSVSDASPQMYIPASGQIVSATDSDPSGGGIITYIQPVNTISSGGHTQVLMAVAEDDTEGIDSGNSVRIRAKEAATIAGNLIGVPVPLQAALQATSPSPSQKGQAGQNAATLAAANSRRRLSNDPRTCEECGRAFKYPSDLKKHLQIHTDMKKFQCDECCRCFRRLHQLNVHKRIHSGEKPYACNRCGAQFRHDSTLTMHIRTRHDHLKPFSCDGCGKNFGRMSHLRKHQRNVCGKGTPRYNLFACKFCEEEFSRKGDLRQHFLTCDKKPEKSDLVPNMYSCEHCPKEFARQYDFKRHQLSHTDEKPYPCAHCAKNFKEKSSLYKHMKRMHSGLAGEAYIEGSQDESTETDAAQRAIATITSSHDAIVTPGNPGDIIVSLSQSITPSSDSDTVATAHALAQAGIIDSADQILHGGHTIAAADILNFPEVAAALGLNPGNQNEHRTMVVTQPVEAVSMISLDSDHVRMQDTGLEDGIAGQSHIDSADEAGAIKQFSTNSVALQLDSDGLIIDTSETSLNPDDQSMINVEQTHIPTTSADLPPVSGNENRIAPVSTQLEPVSTQFTPVHVSSSNTQTIAGDLLKTGIAGVLSGADAERVAASVGSTSRVENEVDGSYDTNIVESIQERTLTQSGDEPAEKEPAVPENTLIEQERDIPMTID